MMTAPPVGSIVMYQSREYKVIVPAIVMSEPSAEFLDICLVYDPDWRCHDDDDFPVHMRMVLPHEWMSVKDYVSLGCKWRPDAA